jgi:hypothetical protein
LPSDERNALYEQARANLEAEGIPFDASWWTDAEKFSAFIGEAYRLAGCEVAAEDGGSSVATIQQPLHSDDGPDFYCGPGHGLPKLTRPRVSQCMNDLCRLHDACYAMCTGPTSALCMWNANTDPCDGSFLEEISDCPSEPGTEFASGAVEFVANGLDLALALTSCDGLSCPQFGELGQGVCSTDTGGSDCLACLSETDRGSICYQASCIDEPDDAICYSANCPIVAECFGGYGKGIPNAIQPEPPVLDPTTVPWDLVVYYLGVPPTKPSGLEWDVDLFGYSPPDPFVRVTVGSEKAETPSPEDVYFWQSNDPVLRGLTASDLMAGISFDVWDEDFSDDDQVGSCFAQPTDSEFTAEFVEAECGTPGLHIKFYVVVAD